MCYIKKSVLLFLTTVVFHFSLRAQENLTGYWQPQVALNYPVAANYSHNFSMINRNYLYRDSKLQLHVRHLDVVHFSKLKIRDNQSLGFGIQYRYRDGFKESGENELRFTQQFNSSSKKRSLRFGHRVRTQQRITASTTVHRFSYRFALDFPLQGEQLDIGESYAVLSTQPLLSVGKAMSPEYDQRITAQLGWLLNKNTRIQVGSQYRIENYTQNAENILFFLTGLVLSL